MKVRQAIGLSIIVAALLSGIVVGCRQEARPQFAGGYGPSHLYVDPEWQLWVDVRSMEANDGVDLGDVTVNNAAGANAVNIQDGGNVISVDDAGASLSVDDAGDSLSIDFAGLVPEVVYATDEDSARLGLVTNPRPQLWNRIATDEDGSFDLERNNCEEVLLASASRTATTNSMPQTNYNGSRLLLIVDVSGINATPIVTPTLQVRDPSSSNYFTVWTASTGLAGVATTAYYFADGASGGSFTEILAFGLPSRMWRTRMVHHDADAITYTVGSVVSIY